MILWQAEFRSPIDSFFDTVLAEVPGRAAAVVADARAAGIHLRLVDDDHVGISVGEDATAADLSAVRTAFGVSNGHAQSFEDSLAGHERTSAYLTHPVFNTHHSETAMLRYLRALSDRDFALDRGMIPLGSCTMKLNATTEMEPISYPGFANLHPFAPIEDAQGYATLIELWSPGSPSSPATPRSPSSPTPAARASWPGCWPSGRTTSRAVISIGGSA